jgi:hypothetical protein
MVKFHIVKSGTSNQHLNVIIDKCIAIECEMVYIKAYESIEDSVYYKSLKDFISYIQSKEFTVSQSILEVSGEYNED